MIGTIILLLTAFGHNQCKAGDTVFVEGYLMESSCATLQYSGAVVWVRHARECLRHTSRQMASFAVLESQGKHTLWHIDSASNGELVQHFGLLEQQANVGVTVRGIMRRDPAKGDTIGACSISLVPDAHK